MPSFGAAQGRVSFLSIWDEAWQGWWDYLLDLLESNILGYSMFCFPSSLLLPIPTTKFHFLLEPADFHLCPFVFLSISQGKGVAFQSPFWYTRHKGTL